MMTGCGHAQRCDEHNYIPPRQVFETKFCDTEPRYEGRYVGPGATDLAPWNTFCEYHARLVRPSGQIELRSFVDVGNEEVGE